MIIAIIIIFMNMIMIIHHYHHLHCLLCLSSPTKILGAHFTLKPIIYQCRMLNLFLIFSQGDYGILKYQDTSTGKPVAELFTKLGKCDCMTQNPYNAVIHLGHYNGI